MIVNCVTVYVRENHIADFISASVENHKGTVEEPGNMHEKHTQYCNNPEPVKIIAPCRFAGIDLWCVLHIDLIPDFSSLDLFN